MVRGLNFKINGLSKSLNIIYIGIVILIDLNYIN